jgi:transcriptional regulator with XRE-family HTH domain
LGIALRERADPHALDLPDDTPGVFYAGQRVVAVDGFTSTATATERRKLSGFIRTQRQMANLWLRQLCALAKVSNPYLSQVERGLHDPSVRVPKSIGEALNVMSAGASIVTKPKGLSSVGAIVLAATIGWARMAFPDVICLMCALPWKYRLRDCLHRTDQESRGTTGERMRRWWTVDQLPGRAEVAEVAACTVTAAHGRDHNHAFGVQCCHPHAVQVVYLGHRALTVCHDCRTDSGFLPCREAERLAEGHRDQTRGASVSLTGAAAS